MHNIQPNSRIYETRTCHIWQDEDQIVHLVYKPGAENVLSDSIENLRILTEIAADQRLYVIVDMTSIKSADRDSRQFGAGSEYAAVVGAVAGLVDSPVGRVIMSFFVHFARPTYPTRMFTKEEDACTWLKQIAQ